MELSAGGGKLIFNKVEEALGLLESAENALTELQETATGTVRIGATDSIFSHVLSDKLARFSEKFPAVKLELISSTSPYTVNQLKEGKCDVAFINLPIDDDVTFFGTVGHLTDVFVAGEKYADLMGGEISLKKLQEFPLLMIEENTVARRALSAFTESIGVHLSPDVEVANWDLMKKLVAKGMGRGLYPARILHRGVRKRRTLRAEHFTLPAGARYRLGNRQARQTVVRGERVSFDVQKGLSL